MRTTRRQSEGETQPVISVLQHLPGPSGRVMRLYSNPFDSSLNRARLLTTTKPRQCYGTKQGGKLLARAMRTGNSYRMKRLDGNQLMGVRSMPVTSLMLTWLIDEMGPLSRVRLTASESEGAIVRER